MGRVAKIVIFCQPRIGDTVYLLPALRALRTQYQNAEIVAFANNYVRPLLEQSGSIDRFINADGSLVAAWRLRRERFDLGIDFTTDFTLVGAWTIRLSGAGWNVGCNSAGRGVFFDNASSPAQGHMADMMLAIAAQAGAQSVDRIPHLLPAQAALDSMRQLLSSQGITQHDLVVGIHPGGHYQTQRWPEERFVALADMLGKNMNLKTVFLGGRLERTAIETMKSKTKRKVSSFVAETLSELIGLIALCRVFACNNSGPLHLAVALGIPTVSTMGPTVKRQWYPLGPSHIVLQSETLPCIGCNSGICRIKTHRCMKEISTDEFYVGVTRLIEKTDAAKRTVFGPDGKQLDGCVDKFCL
jgi:ADP-heptose:LPS heptosyltransferase